MAGAGDERPAVVAESSLCGWGWRLVKGVEPRFTGRLAPLEGGAGTEDCVGSGAGAETAEIRSLAQLRALPGMGGRAIARACEGLVC